MWKSNANRLKFKLEAGQKVVIYGALSVYTPRGEYKLIASKITPAGVGDLQFAYEQLKKELLQKGYFNEENKKILPKYPKKVAIITAIPSAALSDMLKIASKRWPLIKFYLYNSLMQGENAKFDVVKNLKKADKKSYDAIVIARGGGSLEDLWTFNTLEVANAIFEAKTPIISAIGHEVDVFISDYVADKRASTPSNAMEILLPDINEHFFMLDDLKKQFDNKISHILHKKEQELINLKKLYQINSIENEFKNKFEELRLIKMQFKNKISSIIDRNMIMLNDVQKTFQQQISYLINKKENELNNLKNQYNLNNPEKKEKKGFVEISKNGKRVLLNELKKGDIIKLNDTKIQRSAIIS
jgi:exodeoxyribonuclease VII large subunit